MGESILILNMNEHSFFIWSAYGVWLVLLVLLFLKVLLRKREIERKLKYLVKEK